MNNRVTQLSCVFLTLIFILSYKSLSQEIDDQTSSQVFGLLDPVFGTDQRLVSGSYYYGPRRGSIAGNPYFIDETWKKGSVTIGNRIYANLDLKYDIEMNQVILKLTNINNAVLQISLRSESINRFVMNNRLFIPYPGINEQGIIQFCEVIVTGEMHYLILKNKKLMLSRGGITDYIYQEYIKQFLLVDNRLIPFKSRRTIYNLYPEHRQTLKRYLRSQGSIPGRNRINDRKAMVEYCNQLVTEQN
jgi:hypothetical protein